MALPPEVRAKYVVIIDSILGDSDLSTISKKKIRQGIQDAVEYDITPQKTAISELIMERFDIFNAKQNGNSAPVVSIEPSDNLPAVNGAHHPSHSAHPSRPSPPKSPASVKRQADSQESSDANGDTQAKKKRKTSVDADAALAAKLQAEEGRLARPTRGGNARKSAPIKKKTPKKKKKTSDRVRASDDSDLEGSDGESKPQKTTGFHKPLNLSPALSTLLNGEIALSRPQTTKKIWEYIKANNLQDPSDKRFIICDDKMRDVFRQEKVHMFTMTKILNQNLYNPEE